MAGFRFAPQSQSSHCSLGAVALLVSIDSFASLRFQRRPTGATFGLLTHGLTGRVSNSSPRHAKTRNTPRGIPGFSVEVAGFEPAAFWSRTKRATKLRYTSISLEPMRGLEPLTC